MRKAEKLEIIKSEVCNKYCKFPELWDEETEGCELCESEICYNCPLGKLDDMITKSGE